MKSNTTPIKEGLKWKQVQFISPVQRETLNILRSNSKPLTEPQKVLGFKDLRKEMCKRGWGFGKVYLGVY